MYRISKKGYFYQNKKRIGINEIKKKINTMKGGDLETRCPVFNLDLILEVIKASNTLIDNTDKSDILIFIGQSPDYLSYIVKRHRNVISVPISGRVYRDEFSIPKKENLDKYCELLTDLGITRELFDNNNIIFVDHSHSGQSPSLFAKVIIRCLGYIDRYSKSLNDSNRQFNFINIVSNIQYPSWIKDPSSKYIKTTGYLLMPNLVAFANEGKPIGSEYKIPRTVPSYTHLKWNSPPDNSTLVNGKECSLKLILYYEFFDRFNMECKELNNENKSSLLYFKKILQTVVNKQEHITLLSELNNSSSKQDICQKVGLVLSQIYLETNVSFIINDTGQTEDVRRRQNPYTKLAILRQIRRNKKKGLN